jgi:hypothetical protein
LPGKPSVVRIPAAASDKVLQSIVKVIGSSHYHTVSSLKQYHSRHSRHPVSGGPPKQVPA